MINGQLYDWESIKVNVLGLALEGITDIEYDEEGEKNEVYGRGTKPIGYGRGNHKAAGKVTLLLHEYNNLKAAAAAVGGILRIPPFPIVVSYKNDDQPLSIDTLIDCVFTKKSKSASQGDTEVTVDVEFKIMGLIKEL